MSDSIDRAVDVLAGRTIALANGVFDLLHVDGTDLIDRPLSERRDRLVALAAPHVMPGRRTADADEAAEAVREGEMPMWIYLPTHPDARLTDAEKAALIKGLEATFGTKGADDGGSDD